LYSRTLEILSSVEYNLLPKITSKLALLQRNEIDFREFGSDATVAEDDVAKLMYYLNCVCIAVNYNDDPDMHRFINYHDWSELSIDEQKQLLVLCYALSPDIFDDKVFFQSDALCQGSSNRFYEINQVRHQILVVQSIIVAGRARQVNKIMAYTAAWMEYCYIQPMQGLTRRLTGQIRPLQRLPQPIYQPQPSSCCCCCCTIS
jgi:hypothetical protein